MAASTDLKSFISSMGSDRALRVEESFGEGFVRLRVAEAERRQAKHDIRSVEDAVIELLRNSRDAGATKIFVASSKVDDIRTLVIIDDGEGVPLDMHEKIFEPRVTSKLDSMHFDRWGVHGRGMALYSIHENALSAGVKASAPGLGTSIKTVFDTSRLSERSDQSTWPKVSRDDEGAYSCSRGPHNIIRTCCEFALESQETCSVYLGSPAEIASSMRRYAKQDAASFDDAPFIQRIALAGDAKDLLEQAACIGLEISERNAHRIISSEVAPVRSVFSILSSDAPGPERQIDLAKDRRGLHVSKDDVAQFEQTLEEAFKVLGDKYFLRLVQKPQVKIRKGKVSVVFDTEEQD